MGIKGDNKAFKIAKTAADLAIGGSPAGMLIKATKNMIDTKKANEAADFVIDKKGKIMAQDRETYSEKSKKSGIKISAEGVNVNPFIGVTVKNPKIEIDSEKTKKYK